MSKLTAAELQNAPKGQVVRVRKSGLTYQLEAAPAWMTGFRRARVVLPNGLLGDARELKAESLEFVPPGT